MHLYLPCDPLLVIWETKSIHTLLPLFLNSLMYGVPTTWQTLGWVLLMHPVRRPIFPGRATWLQEDVRGLHGKHTVLLICTQTVCSRTIKTATFSTELSNHILRIIEKMLVTSITNHHCFKPGVVLGYCWRQWGERQLLALPLRPTVNKREREKDTIPTLVKLIVF